MAKQQKKKKKKKLLKGSTFPITPKSITLLSKPLKTIFVILS